MISASEGCGSTVVRVTPPGLEEEGEGEGEDISQHGEEILENFGHVEFMTAQVVPVSLILAIRREDTLE
ncbi:hypothetical protein BC938DRAFT_478415 [Jimgerdemannia flammicorona]|uniref:Uncharacterized protein n=1 Tax=Jimgerdemannia flammicorona TaxID=994334 RepID=A0A433QMY2_9FUNG|nr:hypothetical protein BC938DRAFT_478415 [Jimgerdemannia flammicorona]